MGTYETDCSKEALPFSAEATQIKLPILATPKTLVKPRYQENSSDIFRPLVLPFNEMKGRDRKNFP
jgi:hypothetical protein